MNETRRVYIGTYTDNEPSSYGIFTAVCNMQTGSLTDLKPAVQSRSPSYLAIHPSRPILYAVNECSMPGYQGGGLSVFDLNSPDGTLSLLRQCDTLGAAPCHVHVDPKGRWLIISNYRSGNFVLFELDSAGMPLAGPVLFQSRGQGPRSPRQDGPHAHFAMMDPMTDRILMVDLGTDTIYSRTYEKNRRCMSDSPNEDLHVAPGAGCRHLAFSPDAKSMYVIAELDSSVSVFTRNEQGHLAGPVQRLSSLPPGEDSQQDQSAAAIDVHPNGRFLFVSNRGSGRITTFEIDKNGRLNCIAFEVVKCQTPRFCAVIPGGNHFIVCGQDTGTVETFRIDSTSGRFLPNEQAILKIPQPVCACFGPPQNR